MVKLTVSQNAKVNLESAVKALRSEGEVNDFMEQFGAAYEDRNSKIDDATAAKVFSAAKAQLQLLRLRGPA